MRMYPFPSNCNWVLFVDDKAGWACFDEQSKELSIPPPEDIVRLLDDVKTVFDRYPGCKNVNSYPLSVLSSEDVPTTFKGRNIIFLTSKGRFWAQYIYQFAHELCHFIIHKEVAEQLRWFEESVCEVASYFCLNQLSIKWTTNAPYSNWIEYAPALLTYCLEAQKKAFQIPDETTFSDFFRGRILMLSKQDNCYHRDINALCAKHMLPIFEKHPDLWSDVPLLGEVASGKTFYASLADWFVSATDKEAVAEIISLFN